MPLPSQTPVEHGVPAGSGDVGTHVCTPVAQLVSPYSQGSGGMQALFALHTLQTPLSQTWFGPHPVPLLWMPFWSHTGRPLEQSVVPVSHTAGEQGAFCVHELQLPLRHTALVPHEVPLPTGSPVSVHVGVPPLHDSVPVSHTFAGVQDPPLAHMMQLPLSQTSFVPHEVPFRTSLPVSWHTGWPVEQSIEPTWQVLVGEHEAPSVHAPHVPS